MSDLVPEDWKVLTIESVLDNIIDYRGKSPPKSEVGIPLITAKNVRKGYIDEEPREFIYENQFDTWMVRGTPRYGDVFITTEAPLGNVAKVPKYKFAIGQRLLALSPSADILSSDFLLQILQGEKFTEQLDLQSTGSTVAGIKQSTFKKMPLPIPPLPEQQKIAAILSSVDEVIEKTQAQINKLKDLKSGMMQELLSPREGQAANINNPQGESKNSLHHTEFKDSPLGRIPVDWEVRKFGDITLEHKQGFYSKDKYTADGTYLIRITDMQNPYISFTEMPKMIISDKDKEAYKVLNGDFLFARSGAIGRYGIFDSSNEAVFASYLIRFRFNLEKALNEFVGFWYESDVCQKQLGTITQGSSNININALNIKELKIPIPSINEQQKITQAILSVVRKTTVFQRKLNTLKNTKKALMQDLLTGKVRVKVDAA